MAGLVEVGRSLDMVRKAAKEFFLEGFEYADAIRIIEQTRPENKIEARKSLLNYRTLPDGCYAWIAYLLWLERVLEVSNFPLHAVEAESLAILKRERISFQASHPPCPFCGMPNEALTLRCRECGKEINKS